MWRYIGGGFFFRVDELDRDVGFRGERDGPIIWEDSRFKHHISQNLKISIPTKLSITPRPFNPSILITITITIDKYHKVLIDIDSPLN